MKKVFEKHETLFCILLIIAYIIVNSYCIQNFGIEDYRSTIINTIFSISLIILIKILKKNIILWINKSNKIKRISIFYSIIINCFS